MNFELKIKQKLCTYVNAIIIIKMKRKVTFNDSVLIINKFLVILMFLKIFQHFESLMFFISCRWRKYTDKLASSWAPLLFVYLLHTSSTIREISFDNPLFNKIIFWYIFHKHCKTSSKFNSYLLTVKCFSCINDTVKFLEFIQFLPSRRQMAKQK